MRRVPRWLVVVASLVALYAALGFVVVPWVLKAQLEKRLPPLLHRDVAIRQVRFNPFAISLTVRGLQIHNRDGSMLLGFEELYVDVALLREFLGGVRIAEVRLVQPEIGVSIGKDGKPNFADLIEGGPEKPPPPKEEGKPLVIEVGHLIIDRGTVDFADDNQARPFKARIAPLSIVMDNFTTEPQKNGVYDFRALLEPSTRLEWKGDLSISPLRSSGVISITGIRIDAFTPYFADSTQLRVTEGTVDLRLPYRYDASAKPEVMALDDASMKLSGLVVKAPQADEVLIALGTIATDGISVDVSAEKVRIKSVAIQDGRILARRFADGTIQLRELASPREKLRAQAGAGTSKWTAKVDQLSMKGLAATWEDHVPKAVARLPIEDLALTLGPWEFPADVGAPLELSMRLLGEGRFSARGIIHTATGALDLDLSLDNLPFPALRAYAAEAITASVNGALGVHGHFAIGPAAPVKFSGDVLLTGVALTGADGKELAGFDRFELTKIATDTSVTTLDKVLLRGGRANYHLNPDGTNNWSTLMRQQKAAASPPAGQQAAPPAGGKTAEAKPAKVSINAIVLDNLALDFSDRSVQPPFATRLQRFGGTIAPFRRPAMAKSRIDLSGKLDGARILATGTLLPAGKDSDLDLVISLSPWDLPPTTAYGVKYAGYPVEKGKFSLDVKYTLKDRKLQGANLVTIDQLALGPAQESPTATKMPVKLALAILTDKNGRLRVDVPVEGDIDDPDFHFGGVIGEALLNVLGKVAAAPFGLIGGLFDKDEDPSFVEFQPGGDDLAEADEAKVAKVVKALEERPALRLSVVGLADPETDRSALLEQQLDGLLVAHRRTTSKTPVKDDEPLTEADRAAGMRALWTERVVAPKEAEAARLRAEGREPPPGLVPPRDPPPDARAQLLGALSLDPDDLADLARRRAEEVEDELVNVHHLAPERVFVSVAKPQEKPRRQALLQLDAQ